MHSHCTCQLKWWSLILLCSAVKRFSRLIRATMNGAAMDCRPENVLRSQHQDSSSLRSPGYHLQNVHPRLQNSHPQHSKAMNYKSLSDPLVDGSDEYFQTDRHSVDSRRTSRPGVRELDDRRFQTRVYRIREPIELPVPKFQIDENYVGDLPTAQDSKCIENSKDLDLDTRIDLLIKSKALAGMHPIFSDLDQSEDSSPDSDESFLENKPKFNHSLFKKHKLSPPPQEEIPYVESFDDPETPLSRPPSPFLSRATYLFWFNKAIELKQQAKAQEQALLEKATKKLQDNSSVVITNQTVKSNQENKPLLKNLLNEVCKELKVVVKEEFIRDVIESTAFSTLEDWWESQSKLKEPDELKESSVGNSHREKKGLESLRSTSPKLPYPRKKKDLNCSETSSRRGRKSSKKTSHKQSSSLKRASSNKTVTDSTKETDMKIVVEEKAEVQTKSSSVPLRSCYVNMLSNNMCHQSTHSVIENKSNFTAKQNINLEPAGNESNAQPILGSSTDKVEIEIDDGTIKTASDNSLNCENKEIKTGEPSAECEIHHASVKKVARQKSKFPDSSNCSSEHSEKLQMPENVESPPEKTIEVGKADPETEDCQVKEKDSVNLKEKICKVDSSNNNQCEDKSESDDVKDTDCSNPIALS